MTRVEKHDGGGSRHDLFMPQRQHSGEDRVETEGRGGKGWGGSGGGGGGGNRRVWRLHDWFTIALCLVLAQYSMQRLVRACSWKVRGLDAVCELTDLRKSHADHGQPEQPGYHSNELGLACTRGTTEKEVRRRGG